MTEARLIAGSGTSLIKRHDLLSIGCPPPTRTWFPRSHSQVLETVEQSLGAGGFSVESEEFCVSNDQHRFFGTLTLRTQVHEGVALAVGIRNSTDRTFPLGMVAGSRVFVCSNLSFHSEILVNKKHTKHGQERFYESIAASIQKLASYQQVEASRISAYRSTELSENEACGILLHAFEEEVLSTKTLPVALKEWRTPTLDDFKPRTAWSAWNAITNALRLRQGNMAQFASLTIRGYEVMDRSINFSQAG